MIKITAKQRAELRAQGNKLKPIVFIGKDGINKNTVTSIEETLSNRELIKVKLLQNCLLSRGEVADKITEATQAVQVQQIGRTILFYRPLPEDDDK